MFGHRRNETGLGKNCTIRSFITCTFLLNKIRMIEAKDEMGGSCSTNGGEEECI
jgi:hypothetical protein